MDYNEILNKLPIEQEIKRKSQQYDHLLCSMGESIWMPKGFRQGAMWVIQILKKQFNIQ